MVLCDCFSLMVPFHSGAHVLTLLALGAQAQGTAGGGGTPGETGWGPPLVSRGDRQMGRARAGREKGPQRGMREKQDGP